MNIDDLLRAGNGILYDVVQAVNTEDFSDLGQKISARVKGLKSKKTESFFLVRRPGKSGSILRAVFGGLGLAVFGILGIVSLAGVIVGSGAGPIAGLIIFGILALGFGLMMRKGLYTGRLIDRYYAYGRQVGDAEFFSLSSLASATGKTEWEIRDDLLSMKRNGYLPQARMDAQQKTLILTEEAYDLYRQAEESRLQRESEEAARRKEEEKGEKAQKTGLQKKQEAETQEAREIREILERGNAYILKVRNVNDVIPDTEEMSAKLYRLEEIMHRIFEQVQKQPESAAGLRRFMDYYLPTTEKLLDAYIELDKQPVSSGSITKTKQEIDEAMDVINDAFENLLNSMFQDMAWDISSDISVMKMMLAQDGLTQKELLPR